MNKKTLSILLGGVVLIVVVFIATIFTSTKFTNTKEPKNPPAPNEIINSINTSFNAQIVGSYTSPGESSKVAVFGDTAYLTDISEGLLAIDVSDPRKPKLLDSIKIDGGGAYAIAPPDPYFASREYTPQPIFVSGYGNSKLVAIDVSDPKNLKIIARGEAKRSIQNMVSFGAKLSLALDGPEFEVFEAIPDVNERSFGVFKSLGTVQTTPGGHVLDIKHVLYTEGSNFQEGSMVFSNVLLVAQGEKGIALFRLDKGGPSLLETLDVGGYAHAVGVDIFDPRNKVAYMISDSKLIVIGVNPYGDAKELQEKARLQLQGSGEMIAVYGGIGAVALWEMGVEILDLRDPIHPVSLGVVDTPGRARDVAIKQKGDTYYIYVADDRDDLQIIEAKI